MNENEETLAYGEKDKVALISMAEKIAESENFLSIFTENYKESATCALQLGMAILMEKPLFFVVPHGTKVPKSLQRVASGIEFFDKDDPESLRKATQRLLSERST